MALKPCPKCKKLIPCGLSYCPDCAAIAATELEAIRARNAQRKQRLYNNSRSRKYSAFYGSKPWRQTSRAFLQAAGYRCQAKLVGCQGLACEVHHKEHIQTPGGWDRRLDWENLEAVCTACHNGRHPEKLRRQDPGVIDLRTVER